MSKPCMTCKYRSGFGASKESRRLVTCDYLLITGSRRGCSPENCEKYEQKTKTRRANDGYSKFN